MDPSWDVRGPAKQTPPPFVSSFLESGGPPHLWDGSSLGARKLRGSRYPNTPPRRPRLAKRLVSSFCKPRQRFGCLGIYPDALLHCARVWICFLGFRVSFSSRKLIFFHCYCLAQQKSPSARGYGHDHSSLGRQDLRNNPGAHQVASRFCCLGRAGQGGGVFCSFHCLFKLFGSRQPEGEQKRPSAAELIRCICSTRHAKPVPRCKTVSFTPLLAAPN